MHQRGVSGDDHCMSTLRVQAKICIGSQWLSKLVGSAAVAARAGAVVLLSSLSDVVSQSLVSYHHSF